MGTCTFKSEEYLGVPIGMFHCPECGEMVVAGAPHPDYSILDVDLGSESPELTYGMLKKAFDSAVWGGNRPILLALNSNYRRSALKLWSSEDVDRLTEEQVKSLTEGILFQSALLIFRNEIPLGDLWAWFEWGGSLRHPITNQITSLPIWRAGKLQEK